MREVIFRTTGGPLAPTDDYAVFSRDRWPGYSLDFNQSNSYINGTSVSSRIYLLPCSGALMILRTATVYTVICALLLCPYPCLARAANICSEKNDKDCDCQESRSLLPG